MEGWWEKVMSYFKHIVMSKIEGYPPPWKIAKNSSWILNYPSSELRYQKWFSVSGNIIHIFPGSFFASELQWIASREVWADLSLGVLSSSGESETLAGLRWPVPVLRPSAWTRWVPESLQSSKRRMTSRGECIRSIETNNDYWNK